MRVRISGFGFPVANPVSQGLGPGDGSLAVFLSMHTIYLRVSLSVIY